MLRPNWKFALIVFTLLASMLFVTGCTQQRDSDWRVQIGDKVPDFSLKDLEGKTWSPAELKGKPYLMAVFATWCPPCKEELQALETQVWQPLKDLGIQVIAVNFGEEDTETIKRFASDERLSFPILIDEPGSLRQELGVQMIPQSVVVGPDGEILNLHTGYDPDALRGTVQELKDASK